MELKEVLLKRRSIRKFTDQKVNDEIIEELLHHPMKNKLRLIHDGSWYTHRIWFHVDKFHKTIIINPEICWVGTDENSEFRSMSKQMDNMTRIKEKIQFLMDNFKVVYIAFIIGC